MQLINKTTGEIISTNVKIANTFFYRFLGLMFRKSLDREEALIITPCNNIHMFFMNFAIDVLFVNKDNKVCYIQESLKPGQLSKYVKEAKYVVELPVGKITEKNIELGNEIFISNKE